MGCIYKPNPRCRFYYMKYKGVDGKLYVESTRVDNKEAAKKLLRAKESKIDAGVPMTPEVGKLTFEDAVKDLVAFYTKKGRRSLDELQRRVRLHLEPFFHNPTRLSTITSADIDRYVAKRQADTIRTKKAQWIEPENGDKELVPEQRRPVSNSEINRELGVLRSLFTRAIKNGRLMTRPTFELLAEPRPRQGFFDCADVDELCKHLPADIQAVVTFAFITGWRVSETLGLEWSRVDFEGRGHVRLASGTTKNVGDSTIVFSVSKTF